MQQHQQQKQQQAAQQQQNHGSGSIADVTSFEPELAIVFASCNYGSQLQDVVAAVRRAVPSVRHIFGCSAFGVLGASPAGAVEVEGEPGVALTLAQLPGVEVSLVHTLRSSLPSEDASPEAWADLVGISPLQLLSPSTPPSGTNSQDEEETEGEEDGGEQQGQQQQLDTTSSKQQQQQQQQSSPTSEGTSSSSDKGSSESSSSSISNSSRSVESSQPSSSSKESVQQAFLRRSFNSSSSSSQLSVGVDAAGVSSAVSFLVLCDPRFQQSRQLLAGLDFAFPGSNKAGAVLSQGQVNKRRLMFVWSADGAVQPGTAAWRRKQRKRREQQQQLATAAAAPASSRQKVQQPDSEQRQDQQQQQQQKQWPMEPPPLPQQQQPVDPQSGGQKSSKGLFGSLFDSLLSSLADDDTQQQQQQQQQGSRLPQQRQQQLEQQSAWLRSGSGSSPPSAAADGWGDAPAADQANAADDIDENKDDDDDTDSSGVFMYGAAVLSLKGPLVMEPLTCQGYRTVSDKVWIVGETSRDGDLIGGLIDPDAEPTSSNGDDDDAEGVLMMAGGSEGGEGAQVVPLIAVYDIMQAIGPTTDFSDLAGKLAVAIASDSWSPLSSLTPESYTVCAISEVWAEQGYIRIDGQARPGYRMRLVLRDEEGVREDLRNRLLGVKREELAAVLQGQPRPPPLGALLFSDIGRGSTLYQSPNYESNVVSSFLPVPLAGAFGAAQVSTVNGVGALYELTSVVAVLRALPQGDEGSSSSSKDQEQQKQAEE